MGSYTEADIIIALIISAAVFIISALVVILCCFLRRRSPVKSRVFVRLTQPRPSFCTLISNNAPYQRVLEEYEEKLMDSDQLKVDIVMENDQTRRMSTGSGSGKRRQSYEKDGPRFPTAVEFPQWKAVNKKKQSQFSML